MKTQLKLIALSITFLALASNADAQNFGEIRQRLNQTSRQVQQVTTGYFPTQQVTNGQHTSGQVLRERIVNGQVIREYVSPPVQPVLPPVSPPVVSPPVISPPQTFPPNPPQICPITGRPIYPQHPVYVSPDRFDGINPHTGGIDTKNEQIDNTYYDPNRESSKYNGTRRWVQRPIYGANGQITGYQEGYVWTNSVTGVEHGELKNVTQNDKGGKHDQIQVKSFQPTTPSPSPKGVHTQIQLRSPSVGGR